MTRVVHCKREPFDVYIGRPSRWGNSFRIGRDGSREEVIAKYREWLMSQPGLLADIHELKGKTLGCWCRPTAGFRGRLLCHGQILAGLADGIAAEDVE